jgi:hypothetical protein
MVLEDQGGGQEGRQFLHVYIEKKNLLKQNIWPISIKLGTNIFCMMGIQVYTNKGPNPLQRGIITKVPEMG